MEHITMYKGTDFHSAFPEVIRLQNGDLLTVFRQAPVRPPNEHEGLRNAVHVHHHQDPGSRTVLVRSTDDGETWDPDSHTIVDSGGDQDLNLAMIAQVSSGQVIVNNMRLFSGWTDEQAAEVENEKWVLPKRPGRNFGRMVWDSLYLYRSDDNGHTFAPAEPFSVESMTYWSHTGKTGVVELPDGTWLLPFHGMGSPEEIGRVYVVRSYDQGKSWVRPSTVAYDPNGQTSFGEPPLLRLANGRLLTMMRTGGNDDRMYQAYSTDDGWTWRGLKKAQSGVTPATSSSWTAVAFSAPMATVESHLAFVPHSATTRARPGTWTMRSSSATTASTSTSATRPPSKRKTGASSQPTTTTARMASASLAAASGPRATCTDRKFSSWPLCT